MDIFDLSAKLSLDTTEYQNGIEGASKSASSFGDIVSGSLKTAMEVGVVAFTAFSTAVAGVATSMASAISETAAYGDSIDKNSQKLGVSSEFYQEWDAVLQHSGTSMEAMKGSFKTLANAVQDASDDQIASFAKLGLSMEDLQNMSTEDVFKATITALQGMEEGTERTAIATDLLGKGSMELGALLNTSAEDTQAMINKVHDLGGVMSDDAIKASARYQDSLQDMQTVFSGLRKNVASEFLPSMADVMDGITMIFSGDSEGIALVEQGVKEMVGKVQELLPQITQIMSDLAPIVGKAISLALPAIIESSSQILMAIGKGIIDNFPTLIETAKNVLTQLGNSFIDNLDTILDTGIEILMALIDGIVDALPQLIDATIMIIEKLTDKLTEPDTLNKVVESAIKIIKALADGLLKALPTVLESMVQIIASLIGAIVMHLPEVLETGFQWLSTLWQGISNFISPFTENFSKFLADIIVKVTDKFPEFLKNGTEILKNMWDGIKNWTNTLKTNISNTVKNVLDWFKEIPKKIKDVGKNIIEGLWNGINDKVDWIKNKIKGFSDAVLSTIKDFFGIHSPSRVFAEVGGFMAEGLAVGWDDEFKDVKRSIENGLDMDMTTSIKTKPIEVTAQETQILALLQQYLPQMIDKSIVMDTGALVGQIAPAMDNALGRMMNREARFV